MKGKDIPVAVARTLAAVAGALLILAALAPNPINELLASAAYVALVLVFIAIAINVARA